MGFIKIKLALKSKKFVRYNLVVKKYKLTQ